MASLNLTKDQILYAEITALNRVVQRLVVQVAVLSGADLEAAMRLEHQQASKELAETDFGVRTDGVTAMIEHAQSILDDIYSTGTTYQKNIPE